MLHFLSVLNWLSLSKSDNGLIPSFYKRYVDDTLAIMPGVDAAENFLDVLNGLHPSIHFTMELSNNDSIPFIGTLITKNSNKLETQVSRKPTKSLLIRIFKTVFNEKLCK